MLTLATTPTLFSEENLTLHQVTNHRALRGVTIREQGFFTRFPLSS
jgi:hypothetical protein